MRRAQIIPASDRRERAAWIACSFWCAHQPMRDAIHDFNRRGVDALKPGSSSRLGGVAIGSKRGARVRWASSRTSAKYGATKAYFSSEMKVA